ncbi:MAG: hypothetical protein AB7D17_01185 [Methanobacteriales archaeon]
MKAAGVFLLICCLLIGAAAIYNALTPSETPEEPSETSDDDYMIPSGGYFNGKYMTFQCPVTLTVCEHLTEYRGMEEFVLLSGADTGIEVVTASDTLDIYKVMKRLFGFDEESTDIYADYLGEEVIDGVSCKRYHTANDDEIFIFSKGGKSFAVILYYPASEEHAKDIIKSIKPK